jgi:putative alpha-1,2-mannosidase
MKRSQGWKNLFDPETKFIRPKKNGNWLEPFDLKKLTTIIPKTVGITPSLYHKIFQK